MAGGSYRGQLTERVVLALELSKEEADRFGAPAVHDAHLLLGLIREVDGIAAQAIDGLGVELDEVRSQVKRLFGDRSLRTIDERTAIEAIGVDFAVTPATLETMAFAAREAAGLGHRYVGTEHVLLGMVRAEAAAAEILRFFGADTDRVRNEVVRLLSQEPPRDVEDLGERTMIFQTVKPPSDGEVAEEADGPDEEGIEAIPTHSDRPADHDQLGHARLASVLAERMRRVRGEDTEAPVASWTERRRKLRHDQVAAREAGSFMVHLHAPWGAGKSSLLRFLARDLRNREPENGGFIELLLGRRKAADRRLSQWIVAEFSAWEHQRLNPPWWWLLAAVQRSCSRELWRIDRGRWLWFWVRDIAWRLWNARAAVFALLIVAGAAAVGLASDWFGADVGSLSALQAVLLTVSSAAALAGTLWALALGAGRWLAIGSAEGAVRFLRRAHDPLGVYRRRFGWLVRSSGRPLTVFVDDLDRCRPAYVVELLEGIQTLFSGEPVAFVVAADRTWLCESFAQGYAEFGKKVGDPARPLGYLFLEKTFQISIEIPPMSEEARDHYWDLLMRGGTADPGEDPEAERDATGIEFGDAATQAEVEERIAHLLASEFDPDLVLDAATRRLNAPEMEEQLRRLLSEFAPLLESNPRSMKRLMNAYGVERDRLLREGHLLDREERQQLALLMILRLRWPELAEHLRGRPFDVEALLDPDLAFDGGDPLISLLHDPAIRSLFDGSVVEVRLDPESIRHFPPQQAQARFYGERTVS